MANETVQFPGRWLKRAPVAGLVAAVAWALLAGAAHAADEPTLVLKGDAEGTKDSPLLSKPRSGKEGAVPTYTYTVSLRPNQAEGLYLFVKNPSGVKRNLSVRLKTDEKFRDNKTAVDVTVEKGKTEPVQFPPPKETITPPPGTTPATPGTAAPAARSAGLPGEVEVMSYTFPFAPPVRGQEVTPFTFSFVIELYDKDDDRALEQRRLDVRIRSPRDYLEPSSPLFTSTADRRTNKWSVSLACGQEFSGPNCPVRLELLPERIPGLVKSPLPGSQLSDVLSTQRPRVTLSASDIHFLPARDENGIVSVSADDFPRAFQFRTTFVREGKRTPELVQGQTLGVGIPRFLTPEMKPDTRPSTKPEPVRLEVDNVPLNKAVRVELAVDKTGEGNNFTPLGEPFNGVKRQRVWFTPPEKGGFLRLRTFVDDYVVNVAANVAANDLAGTCAFRVRLLDDKGKPVEPAEAVAKVIILDKAPAGIAFVKLPKEIPVAQARLPVTVTYPGPADAIKIVDFYLAAPGQTKIPPDAEVKPATPDEGGKAAWSTVLDLPPGQAGPVTVLARFVDQVGHESTAKAAVQRLPPATTDTKAADNPTTGTIVGRVVQFVPPLGQPKLPVLLYDAKDLKTPVKAAQTDGEGNYKFTDVAPGSYWVYSEDRQASVRGSQLVTVTKGKTTKADEIALSRLGRLGR